MGGPGLFQPSDGKKRIPDSRRSLLRSGLQSNHRRLRILCVLMEQEICVADLADTLEMTQSAISHQLRTLKQSKLVKARRRGKMVYYSLDDDHVRSIIETGREHLEEER